MTEGIELRNQEKIRTLGEKKTYKYLGILKTDAIKKWRWKNISGERENYLRLNYIAEISSKGWIHGLSFLQDTRDQSWSGQGKNFNKSTREQEN